MVEEIRRGVDEIRNLLGPMTLKLQNLDHKITESRITFELRTSEFEAKIAANSTRISEQTLKNHEYSSQIAALFERVQWIEAWLDVPKPPKKEPGKSG
ncbi:MAG: hypothetical protein ACREFR_16720 [Limisphaerales bacterium]